MEDNIMNKLLDYGDEPKEYDRYNDTTPQNPQILFSWKAPLRAYKRKSAGVLRFYAALALLLTLIVFFLNERMLILPIWTTVFLVYVLTITPPPIVENKITKFGIEIAGATYRWEYFSHFYFIDRFDYKVLVLVGQSYVYAVIKKDETKQKLIHMLSEHIIYQENPQKTFTEKMAEALTKIMSTESIEKEEPEAVSAKPAEQSL